MKRYRNYMDRIKASDTLHQRLVELEAPSKRPIPWKKFGAAAAALALVCGLGAWGLGQGGWEALAGHFRPETVPAIADDQPDIATAEPGDVTEPGEKTLGGYEVMKGGMTAYYPLPAIDYGTLDGVMRVDASLVPPDGGMRELTGGDVLAVFGLDEEGLSTHLDWGGYALQGSVGFHADGSTCMMNLGGTADDGYFSLELRAGELPLRCYIIVDEQRTVTDVWGVEVSGVKNMGAYGDTDRGVYWDVTREVEFMAGDVGVRFKAYGSDDDAVERFTSRFVRWAIVEGLDLSRAVPDGALPAEAQPSYSVGEPNYEDGVSAQEGDTPAYDPGETYTCSDCGQAIPVGMDHYHTLPRPLDGGDPHTSAGGTNVCPICGETLPEGMEHSHELCGLPLAPVETSTQTTAD